MDKKELKSSSLYQNVYYSIRSELHGLIDCDYIAEKLMPLFESFIEDRLTEYGLYTSLREELLKENQKVIVPSLKEEKKKWVEELSKWLMENIKFYSTNALGVECLIDDLKKDMKID